jgi:hypothetical protein
MSNLYKYNLYLESPYNISESPWERVFLPVFASHDIERAHTSLRTAIVAIHGYTRNAADFFSSVLEATYPRNDTVAIVPYFSDHQVEGWGSNKVNNTASLFWKTSNWMKGLSNMSILLPVLYRNQQLITCRFVVQVLITLLILGTTPHLLMSWILL